MRILHTEASPGWGGQEIRILREAEGMRRRGHTLYFAVVRKGKLASEARKAGFPVCELFFQKWAWPLTLVQLLFLFWRWRIELINTHSSLDSWIGGISARIVGIPIVRTRHLSTPIRPGWNSRWLYGRLADFVVTTCSSVLPMIAEQSGKSKERLRSVPTGVDIARMQSSDEEAREIRNSLNVKEEDFLIGTACFMRSWKGLLDLLEAAHLLRAEPRIRWVIIGGGHEEVYRERAKQLGLNDLVSFTGHLVNPIPAIQALDLFALLSTAHEGVSQAILQAAYLQKPLIATSVGGLQEVCLHGQTGLSVDSHSPHQVVEAVLSLLRDRTRAHRFGQEAKRLVLSKFTLKHTLDTMEEINQKVLNI